MLNLAKVVLIGFALVLVPAVGAAEGASLGEIEYKEKCAICHGVDGTGNGPYAEMLNVKPSDLTLLQRNNRGIFPLNQIHLIIDGRLAEVVHGQRDMPIWGNSYNAEAQKYYSDYYGAYDPESFVRVRIMALIEYLDRIQKK